MKRFLITILGLGIIGQLSLVGQFAIGTGGAKDLYEKHCMICHGEDLKGGLGGSLIEMGSWKRVGNDVSFIDYVLSGDEDLGMPAFEEVLSRAEIRSLEILIAEKRLQDSAGDLKNIEKSTFFSDPYEFSLETVVDGLETPWSLAFLPSGGMLITEKKGQLRHFSKGQLKAPVRGLPEVWESRQGGLLEVALHPDYEDNGWVYLSYSALGADRKGMTRVVRGRIDDNKWIDEEVIFEAPEATHSNAGFHFGSRIAFKDGYLFFSVGDRGRQDDAQDLSLPGGKIHRIHDDGRVPGDNPFVEDEGSFPTIWTYGNRNPQGLDFHPITGELWESEHGPRGGDEINVIERGVNYGWPVITYGMNYNGSPITDRTEAPGMAQPKTYWTPSISVCGIDFYEGDLFPSWKYDLFVGGLASKQLHRLKIEDGEVVSDTIVLEGVGRVRDVSSGPDGYLYLVLNSPDQVVRLIPTL